MKMEEPDARDSTIGEELLGTGKTIYALQTGSIKDFLEKLPGQQVKQEPDGSSLQEWEVQLQEFLKTVETPQSGWGSPQLPEEPVPWDDAKAFLASFEQVAEACQWPKEEWVTRLLPALKGEAERAFSRLEARDRKDYGKVKAAILRGDAMRREKQRQHFRGFCYQEAEGPRGAFNRLQELGCRWLKMERHTKEQILELLILEQFLAILPAEIQCRVKECGPGTCSQAVALAERFLQQQQQREAKRLEKSVLTQSEISGAVISFSEIKWTPRGIEQRPLGMQIKQEREEEEEAILLGDEWMCLDKEGRHPTEDLVHIGLPEISVGKKGEDDGSPWCPKQENTLESLHNSEYQKESLARERENESVSDGGNYKDLRKPTPCQRIHAGKRRNTYNISSKSFALGSSLNRHKRTHTAETPHKCLVCGKCFVYSSNLIQHKRTHTGEKPYECSVCGKRFSANSDCSRHERIHTGEKPYKCSECGKRFRLASDLSRHRRIHTGEKLYECLDCKKRFTQKANLDTHRRKIHTGNNLHHCSKNT
uniref:Uncharacterized protein n=1 Tax=Salvator merianae TaxID=96440 RepID=A0A8D0E2I8_SALMN